MATTTTDADSDLSRALVPYEGAGLERAAGWVAIPGDERRRRAMEAAQLRDVATLLSLTESWLIMYGRRKKQTSPLTLSAYRQGITALIAAWRSTDLLKADTNAATLWLESIAGHNGAGATPSTRIRYRAAGRALYSALRWARATEADPFKDAHVEADSTAAHEKRKPYAQDDVERLVAHATGDDKVLVLLGAHAGLRVSEMLALRWDDINLTTRALVVRYGKGSKQREVDMSAGLVRALQALQEDGERVVGKRAGYVLPYATAFSARRRVRLLCERAGVERTAGVVGLHSLRHAAGTRIYADTGRLDDAQKLLGHSSLGTTQIYAQHSNKRVKEAVGKWT